MEKINFSFAKGHEVDVLDDLEMEKVKDYFSNFERKYSSYLKENRIFVYIKKHKEKTRKIRLFFVRVRIERASGKINAHAEGFGLKNAVHNAIDKLVIQIEKQKTLHNKRKTRR